MLPHAVVTCDGSKPNFEENLANIEGLYFIDNI